MRDNRLDTLYSELTFVRTVVRRFSQDRVLVKEIIARAQQAEATPRVARAGEFYPQDQSI